jgi:Fe-S-cluster containining protein
MEIDSIIRKHALKNTMDSKGNANPGAICFEEAHTISDGMMLDLCQECKGKCEKDGKSPLLPGEEGFIAKKLGMPVSDFIDRFCNTIRFRGHDAYLLKAGKCPFLNPASRCELEKHDCKPLLCLLYPACIGVYDDGIRMSIDHEECPAAGKLQPDFKEKARQMVESIKHNIPKWWLDMDFGDEEKGHFDYSKLERLKDKKVASLDEWRKCVVKQ